MMVQAVYVHIIWPLAALFYIDSFYTRFGRAKRKIISSFVLWYFYFNDVLQNINAVGKRGNWKKYYHIVYVLLFVVQYLYVPCICIYAWTMWNMKFLKYYEIVLSKENPMIYYYTGISTLQYCLFFHRIWLFKSQCYNIYIYLYIIIKTKLGIFL